MIKAESKCLASNNKRFRKNICKLLILFKFIYHFLRALRVLRGEIKFWLRLAALCFRGSI